MAYCICPALRTALRPSLPQEIVSSPVTGAYHARSCATSTGHGSLAASLRVHLTPCTATRHHCHTLRSDGDMPGLNLLGRPHPIVPCLALEDSLTERDHP